MKYSVRTAEEIYNSDPEMQKAFHRIIDETIEDIEVAAGHRTGVIAYLFSQLAGNFANYAKAINNAVYPEELAKWARERYGQEGEE